MQSNGLEFHLVSKEIRENSASVQTWFSCSQKLMTGCILAQCYLSHVTVGLACVTACRSHGGLSSGFLGSGQLSSSGSCLGTQLCHHKMSTFQMNGRVVSSALPGLILRALQRVEIRLG